MQRGLRIILVLVVFIMFIGLTVSWFVASELVKPRNLEVGTPPISLPISLGLVPVSFDSESGGKIFGWHGRAKESRGVILLLHGIRSNRTAMVERARFLTEQSFSVLLIDLQAHGESLGKEITVGYREKYDVRAAVSFAKSQHPGEGIGIIGVSLGGAAAVLGAPLAVDGMIIESIYPDIRSAVANRVEKRLGAMAPLATWLLLWQLEFRLNISPGDLRPIDKIAAVGCPILIISGSLDSHTTEEETRAIYAAAHKPKSMWIVPGAGHVDLHRFLADDYARRVVEFFSETL